MQHLRSLATLCALTAFLAPSVRAIEIADEFTYAGTNGWAASRALATDYANYPVFEAVGFLRIFFGIEEFTGSATLLNNEWVLTAGHNWNATKVTSLQFVFQGDEYEADMESLVQHPLWTNAPPPLKNEDVGASQGWDIALFRLSAPITNSIAFPELYTKSDEAGKVGFALGAGKIGTGTIPWEYQTNSPSLIYAAASIIDRATSQTNSGYAGGLLGMDFDGDGDTNQNTFGANYATNDLPWLWKNSSEITETLDPEGVIIGTNSSASQYTDGLGNILEGGTAPGDSGGPLFIFDGEAGSWKIAGITSWGENPWDEISTTNSSRGLYGDVNYFTRVSENADWIYSVIPEPSTTALLTVCGLAACAFVLFRAKANKNDT